MILGLAGVALAADAPLLRTPLGRGAVGLDVSPTAVSIAGAPGERWAVGLAIARDAYVDASAGGRLPLTGEGRTTGIEVGASGGIAALLATPGVAATGSGWIAGGVHADDARATLGLVVPVQVRPVPPVQLAVPVLFEARLGLRLGPVWLGSRAAMGPVLSAGGPPALGYDLGFQLWTVPPG